MAMKTISATVPAAVKTEAAAVAAAHGISMAELVRELLAQCDPSAEPTAEDREWDNMPDVGREVLTPFDPAEALTTAEAVAAFLADAEATGDPAYIEHAHQVAARARTMYGLEG